MGKALPLNTLQQQHQQPQALHQLRRRSPAPVLGGPQATPAAPTPRRNVDISSLPLSALLSLDLDAWDGKQSLEEIVSRLPAVSSAASSARSPLPSPSVAEVNVEFERLACEVAADVIDSRKTNQELVLDEVKLPPEGSERYAQPVSRFTGPRDPSERGYVRVRPSDSQAPQSLPPSDNPYEQLLQRIRNERAARSPTDSKCVASLDSYDEDYAPDRDSGSDDETTSGSPKVPVAQAITAKPQNAVTSAPSCEPHVWLLSYDTPTEWEARAERSLSPSCGGSDTQPLSSPSTLSRVRRSDASTPGFAVRLPLSIVCVSPTLRRVFRGPARATMADTRGRQVYEPMNESISGVIKLSGINGRTLQLVYWYLMTTNAARHHYNTSGSESECAALSFAGAFRLAMASKAGPGDGRLDLKLHEELVNAVLEDSLDLLAAAHYMELPYLADLAARSLSRPIILQHWLFRNREDLHQTTVLPHTRLPLSLALAMVLPRLTTISRVILSISGLADDLPLASTELLAPTSIGDGSVSLGLETFFQLQHSAILLRKEDDQHMFATTLSYASWRKLVQMCESRPREDRSVAVRNIEILADLLVTAASSHEPASQLWLTKLVGLFALALKRHILASQNNLSLLGYLDAMLGKVVNLVNPEAYSEAGSISRHTLWRWWSQLLAVVALFSEIQPGASPSKTIPLTTENDADSRADLDLDNALKQLALSGPKLHLPHDFLASAFVSLYDSSVAKFFATTSDLGPLLTSHTKLQTCVVAPSYITVSFPHEVPILSPGAFRTPEQASRKVPQPPLPIVTSTLTIGDILDEDENGIKIPALIAPRVIVPNCLCLYQKSMSNVNDVPALKCVRCTIACASSRDSLSAVLTPRPLLGDSDLTTPPCNSFSRVGDLSERSILKPLTPTQIEIEQREMYLCAESLGRVIPTGLLHLKTTSSITAISTHSTFLSERLHAMILSDPELSEIILPPFMRPIPQSQAKESNRSTAKRLQHPGCLTQWSYAPSLQVTASRAALQCAQSLISSPSCHLSFQRELPILLSCVNHQGAGLSFPLHALPNLIGAQIPRRPAFGALGKSWKSSKLLEALSRSAVDHILVYDGPDSSLSSLRPSSLLAMFDGLFSALFTPPRLRLLSSLDLSYGNVTPMGLSAILSAASLYDSHNRDAADSELNAPFSEVDCVDLDDIEGLGGGQPTMEEAKMPTLFEVSRRTSRHSQNASKITIDQLARKWASILEQNGQSPASFPEQKAEGDESGTFLQQTLRTLTEYRSALESLSHVALSSEYEGFQSEADPATIPLTLKLDSLGALCNDDLALLLAKRLKKALRLHTRIRRLCKLPVAPCPLRELNLSGNPLGIEGAYTLARILVSDSLTSPKAGLQGLKVLKIARCAIPLEGLGVLLHALRVRAEIGYPLEFLDIEGNALSILPRTFYALPPSLSESRPQHSTTSEAELVISCLEARLKEVSELEAAATSSTYQTNAQSYTFSKIAVWFALEVYRFFISERMRTSLKVLNLSNNRFPPIAFAALLRALRYQVEVAVSSRRTEVERPAVALCTLSISGLLPLGTFSTEQRNDGTNLSLEERSGTALNQMSERLLSHEAEEFAKAASTYFNSGALSAQHSSLSHFRLTFLTLSNNDLPPSVLRPLVDGVCQLYRDSLRALDLSNNGITAMSAQQGPLFSLLTALNDRPRRSSNPSGSSLRRLKLVALRLSGGLRESYTSLHTQGLRNLGTEARSGAKIVIPTTVLPSVWLHDPRQDEPATSYSLLRTEHVASLASVMANETPSLQLLWLDGQSKIGAPGLTALARLIVGAGAPFLRLLSLRGSVNFSRERIVGGGAAAATASTAQSSQAVELAFADALAKRSVAHTSWCQMAAQLNGSLSDDKSAAVFAWSRISRLDLNNGSSLDELSSTETATAVSPLNGIVPSWVLEFLAQRDAMTRQRMAYEAELGSSARSTRIAWYSKMRLPSSLATDNYVLDLVRARVLYGDEPLESYGLIDNPNELPEKLKEPQEAVSPEASLRWGYYFGPSTSTVWGLTPPKIIYGRVAPRGATRGLSDSLHDCEVDLLWHDEDISAALEIGEILARSDQSRQVPSSGLLANGLDALPAQGLLNTLVSSFSSVDEVDLDRLECSGANERLQFLMTVLKHSGPLSHEDMASRRSVMNSEAMLTHMLKLGFCVQYHDGNNQPIFVVPLSAAVQRMFNSTVRTNKSSDAESALSSVLLTLREEIEASKLAFKHDAAADSQDATLRRLLSGSHIRPTKNTWCVPFAASRFELPRSLQFVLRLGFLSHTITPHCRLGLTLRPWPLNLPDLSTELGDLESFLPCGCSCRAALTRWLNQRDSNGVLKHPLRVAHLVEFRYSFPVPSASGRVEPFTHSDLDRKAEGMVLKPEFSLQSQHATAMLQSQPSATGSNYSRYLQVQPVDRIDTGTSLAPEWMFGTPTRFSWIVRQDGTRLSPYQHPDCQCFCHAHLYQAVHLAPTIIDVLQDDANASANSDATDDPFQSTEAIQKVLQQHDRAAKLQALKKSLQSNTISHSETLTAPTMQAGAQLKSEVKKAQPSWLLASGNEIGMDLDWSIAEFDISPDVVFPEAINGDLIQRMAAHRLVREKLDAAAAAAAAAPASPQFHDQLDQVTQSSVQVSPTPSQDSSLNDHTSTHRPSIAERRQSFIKEVLRQQQSKQASAGQPPKLVSAPPSSGSTISSSEHGQTASNIDLW